MVVIIGARVGEEKKLEPGGGGGLSGATDLAAPEAAELGCLDCVAGHGFVDHVGAG